MKVSVRTLKGIAIASIFTIPFVLLIVSNFTVFPWVFGRNIAFRVLVEIAFFCWLLLVFRDASYLPKRSLLFTSIGVFTIVLAVADIFGVDPYKSIWSSFERMEGFMMFGHLFLYFIVCTSLLTRKLWNNFFYCFIGLSIFSFFYGFLQATGNMPILSQSDRIEAIFGNASYLASFMLFCIFLSLSLGWSERRRLSERGILISYGIGGSCYLLMILGLFGFGQPQNWFVASLLGLISIGIVTFSIYASRRKFKRYTLVTHYVLYGVVILMQLSTLIYTGTRSAMLGFATGIVLAALIIALKNNSNRIRIVLLAGVILVSGLVPVAFVFRDIDFIQKNPVFSRILNFSLKDQPRFIVWNVAWKGIKERPLFGWGQENFDVVFDKYYDIRLLNEEPWFDRAHNVILDMLVSGGGVGLIAYIAVFVFLLRSVWKNSPNEFLLTEKALLTGLIIGYSVNGLFVFDSIATYIFFYSLLGYVLLNTGQIRSKNVLEKLPLQRLSSGGFQIIAGGAVIFVIWILHTNSFVAARNLWGGIAYAKMDASKSLAMYEHAFKRKTPGTYFGRNKLSIEATKIYYDKNIPDDVKEKFLSFAVKQMQLNITESSLRAQPLYNIGEFYGNVGKSTEALQYLKRANELSSNRPFIIARIGLVYATAGQYDEALEVLGKLLDVAPNYRTAAVYYAATVQYKGDVALAEKILLKYTGARVSMEQMMMRAYEKSGLMDHVIEAWEYGLKKTPDDNKLWVHYAAALLKAKEKEKVIMAVHEFVKRDPELKAVGDKISADLKAGVFSDILVPYQGY